VSVAIRKLSAEETAEVFPGRRGQDVSEYMAVLSELRSGDVAAVPLEDLSQRSLKRRFSLAAKELGYRIRWSSLSGDRELVLRVEQVPVSGISFRQRRRKKPALQERP
jgi:hypothetical protein